MPTNACLCLAFRQRDAGGSKNPFLRTKKSYHPLISPTTPITLLYMGVVQVIWVREVSRQLRNIGREATEYFMRVPCLMCPVNSLEAFTSLRTFGLVCLTPFQLFFSGLRNPAHFLAELSYHVNRPAKKHFPRKILFWLFWGKKRPLMSEMVICLNSRRNVFYISQAWCMGKLLFSQVSNLLPFLPFTLETANANSPNKHRSFKMWHFFTL